MQQSPRGPAAGAHEAAAAARRDGRGPPRAGRPARPAGERAPPANGGGPRPGGDGGARERAPQRVARADRGGHCKLLPAVPSYRRRSLEPLDD